MLTEQLSQLRRRRGLPATALGARTGIDTSAIYAFEHGRRDPRASTAQTWARGLGARLLVVDTLGRASAAETAAQIRNALVHGDRNAAAQTLLQLVNSLRASDLLAVAALTVDEPEPFEGGWSWAVAGVVEQETAARGIPTPLWATETAGDPNAKWSPWAPELADLVDVDQVPEPLRRRGVYIEAGELVSA
ncbi:helix-turn-helix domain-containing protein [Microbacterium paraoxydans]|uniref:helix-turn-helix domain-containing protein n=1 Tax=Microbacterium paraoxydans TaxID=199592 RepID=UPI0021A84AD8|nr:helix-turn-helix transcriptional regulator [Microbacterium paraoxydans]MCT2222532.1 helix-turn-helix domain-containing protein [Microbacterium paraoxydans]